MIYQIKILKNSYNYKKNEAKFLLSKLTKNIY